MSILDSVAGLLAAVQAVSSILTTITSNKKRAPRITDSVLSDVNDVMASLSALQRLLSGVASGARQHMALIQLDQLIAVLTELVLIFSELEALLTPFAAGREISIMKGAKWASKEDVISDIMQQRLQCTKSCLSLMLNTVQLYFFKLPICAPLVVGLQY